MIKHYYIVWNEPPHTKRNICAIIKKAISPH